MLYYPKIIFIGTGIFAINILKKIILYQYNIVGVITTPDVIKKNKLIESPIKKIALHQGLNIIQSQDLKNPFFIQKIKKLKPDIQIVVSFKILPKEIWTIPPLGTINLHPSFLPKYRGAAPINWAIINGETETGISTFFINDFIDKGRIILQEKINIFPLETFGDLSNRLSLIGSDLTIKTIKLLLEKNDPFLDKKNEKEIIYTSYAPKIYKKDCCINWNDSVFNIFNKIRGLSPYPGAWTTLSLDNKNYIFKIYNAFFIKKNTNINPGHIKITSSKMIISSSNGYIFVTEAQISGKKKLTIKDIINGIKNKKIFIVHDE